MDLLSRGSVQSYFYLFEGLGINSQFRAGRSTMSVEHNDSARSYAQNDASDAVR